MAREQVSCLARLAVRVLCCCQADTLQTGPGVPPGSTQALPCSLAGGQLYALSIGAFLENQRIEPSDAWENGSGWTCQPHPVQGLCVPRPQSLAQPHPPIVTYRRVSATCISHAYVVLCMLRACRASVEVAAPLETCWALWDDRERIPEWMPWIKSVKVRRQGKDAGVGFHPSQYES